jgi:hypothetical protein
VRRLARFEGESLLEHALDGAIESAGTEPHFFARAAGDVLHDGIAVTLAVDQRDQDLEDGAGD